MGKSIRFVLIKHKRSVSLLIDSDISRRSAYGRELKEEQHDEWHPVFPDLNFLLLKGKSALLDMSDDLRIQL